MESSKTSNHIQVQKHLVLWEGDKLLSYFAYITNLLPHSFYKVLILQQAKYKITFNELLLLIVYLSILNAAKTTATINQSNSKEET